MHDIGRKKAPAIWLGPFSIKKRRSLFMKLVLVRHGESIWNKENLFTGWTDVDLSETGEKEAADAGRTLLEQGYDFDLCYTSYLKRAIHTLDHILEEMDRCWLPVVKTWKLNERHYGALQGLNKSETALKYGEDQVKIWRRSFDIAPPFLEETDPRNPALQEQYRQEKSQSGDILPLGESLKDTIERVVPYYNDVILKSMKEGKRVLVAAHGNSIRALVQYFENLKPEEIVDVNIPTGIPLVYEFDEVGKFIKKEYLGDPEAIKSKMEKVAAQGSASKTS